MAPPVTTAPLPLKSKSSAMVCFVIFQPPSFATFITCWFKFWTAHESPVNRLSGGFFTGVFSVPLCCSLEAKGSADVAYPAQIEIQNALAEWNIG
jgi:hypothetical protein